MKWLLKGKWLMKKYYFVSVLALIVAASVPCAVAQKPSKGTSAKKSASTKNSAPAIMERYVKNTRALRRFICTLEVQTDWIFKLSSIKQVEKVRVVYDGSQRIAVRSLSYNVTGPAGEDKDFVVSSGHFQEIVADGARYYALRDYSDPDSIGEYLLHPLSSEGVKNEHHAAGIFSDSAFGSLLIPKDWVRQEEVPYWGKVVGQQVLDGTICDKLQFDTVVPGPDNKMRTFTDMYWISRKDGLLRRAEINTADVRTIENYSIRQIGGVIRPSEFLIKPPAKARKTRFL